MEIVKIRLIVKPTKFCMPIIMPIIEQKNKLVEYFLNCDDWEQKYMLIIDLGKKLNPVDDNQKTEQNRVQGCTSRLWLVGEKINGKMYFKGSSDSQIVAGLVAILINVYNGNTPEDILSDNSNLLVELGLEDHIMPTRIVGFESALKKIKEICKNCIQIN